jgi:hypothetical protein
VHNNKVASCIFGEPQCLVNLSVGEVLEHSKRLMRGDDFELPRAPRVAARERRDDLEPTRSA